MGRFFLGAFLLYILGVAVLAMGCGMAVFAVRFLPAVAVFTLVGVVIVSAITAGKKVAGEKTGHFNAVVFAVFGVIYGGGLLCIALACRVNVFRVPFQALAGKYTTFLMLTGAAILAAVSALEMEPQGKRVVVLLIAVTLWAVDLVLVVRFLHWCFW